MARIEVAKAPTKKVNARRMLATLCYYYPQYTLSAARRLPAKDVVLLTQVAFQEKAKEYHNLTQIAAAPHTKNGAGVKTLSNSYKEAATNGQ